MPSVPLPAEQCTSLAVISDRRSARRRAVTRLVRPCKPIVRQHPPTSFVVTVAVHIHLAVDIVEHLELFVIIVKV